MARKEERSSGAPQKALMRKSEETKQPRGGVAMVVEHRIDPETGEEVRDTTYHRLQPVSPERVFENGAERERRIERRSRQVEKPTRELTRQIAVEKKRFAKEPEGGKLPYDIFERAMMAK